MNLLDVVYRCGIQHAEVSAVTTWIYDAQQLVMVTGRPGGVSGYPRAWYI